MAMIGGGDKIILPQKGNGYVGDATHIQRRKMKVQLKTEEIRNAF